MSTHFEQIKSLLSLTGQAHMEEFPYEQVYVYSIVTPAGELVIGALGKKGTRVVDVAVLPGFRKLGIASALIDIAEVDHAYVVSKEAENFWSHIGWHYGHKTIDKGVVVKVYCEEGKIV